MLSLQAEIDRGRGLAVMLFQIEANIESLVIYTRPNVMLSFQSFFRFWISKPNQFLYVSVTSRLLYAQRWILFWVCWDGPVAAAGQNQQIMLNFLSVKAKALMFLVMKFCHVLWKR